MLVDDPVWYYTHSDGSIGGPISMRSILTMVRSPVQLQTLVGLSPHIPQMTPLITLIQGAARQNANVQQTSPRGKTLLQLAQEAHPYIDEVIWWAERLGSFIAAMMAIAKRLK
jgi:hypothetical protein